MKTQIPIYRAKKLDSDEYVEGYYFYENIDVVKHEFKNEYREAENHYIGFGNGYADLIDPSTLAISFNNGDTWEDLSTTDTVIGSTFDIKCVDERGIKRRMFQPKHNNDEWVVSIRKVTGIQK
jgi:hypothetical protein